MKNLLLLLIILPVISVAENRKTYGANSDRESTKISLYIPGFLIKAGAWFVSKEKDAQAKCALKKLRSISLVIREGEAYEAYKSSEKYDKKITKLQRQHFESLVEVKGEDTNASVFIRLNKKQEIRQLAVIVNDGDNSFVFARLRCSFSMSDVKNLLQNKKVKDAFSDVAVN